MRIGEARRSLDSIRLYADVKSKISVRTGSGDKLNTDISEYITLDNKK